LFDAVPGLKITGVEASTYAKLLFMGVDEASGKERPYTLDI